MTRPRNKTADLGSKAYYVTDGTRYVGLIAPRDGQFEAHVEGGGYLGKYPTRVLAFKAVLRADRERGATG